MSEPDPFNCPRCGSHDFGLHAMVNAGQCIHCNRRDAERYRWLRDNITFHDIDHDWPVEAPNVPTLAQVSNRLWYHATDNVTDNTLDAAIDAALGRSQ